MYSFSSIHIYMYKIYKPHFLKFNITRNKFFHIYEVLASKHLRF